MEYRTPAKSDMLEKARKIADQFQADFGERAQVEAKRRAVGFSALREDKQARLYIIVERELKRRSGMTVSL